MSYRATVLGCLFLGLALLLAGCEVLGVYEFVSEHKSSAYVAIGSCVIALVTPALPALADWFWRGRQGLYCAFTWVAFLICLAIVLTAAIQRTGSAADGAQQSRDAAQRAEAVAKKAEKDAEADYTAAQSAAIRECATRGKRCMDAEEKAATARAALASARAALVSAPAGEQADPLARRLAAVLTFATEEQVRLMQPMLVPVALSILSALFFAGWSRLDFGALMQPVETPRKPARAQLDTKPRTWGVRAKAPPLPPLPASPGSVAEYLADVLEADEGSRVEVPALISRYRQWCQATNRIPVAAAAFVDNLNSVRKAVGLDIEADGEKVYCMGVRLAA